MENIITELFNELQKKKYRDSDYLNTKTTDLYEYNIADNHYLNWREDGTNKEYLPLVLDAMKNSNLPINYYGYLGIATPYVTILNEYLTQENAGYWVGADKSNYLARVRQYNARLGFLKSLHYLSKLTQIKGDKTALYAYKVFYNDENYQPYRDVNGLVARDSKKRNRFEVMKDVGQYINKLLNSQKGGKVQKTLIGQPFGLFGGGYNVEHKYTDNAEVDIHNHSELIVDKPVDFKMFNDLIRKKLDKKGYEDITVTISPIYEDVKHKQRPVKIELDKSLKTQNEAIRAVLKVIDYDRKQGGLPLLYLRNKDNNGNKNGILKDVFDKFDYDTKKELVTCSVNSIWGRRLRLHSDYGLMKRNGYEIYKKEYQAIKRKLKLIADYIQSQKVRKPIIIFNFNVSSQKITSQTDLNFNFVEYEPPP